MKVACTKFLIIAVMFVLSCPVQAQVSSGISLPDLLKIRPDMASEAKDAGGKQVPMDAPVDPAEYFVGPGDLLALNIWSSMPVAHQLTVTPEGTLLIPNVGVVDVKEQTLEALKKSVSALVVRKYPSAEVTVSLVSARRIVVQVTGDVFFEGKHEISSLQRVDNLIDIANEPPRTVADPGVFREAMYIRRSSSLRNIIIQRKNGRRLRADLIKYRATGDNTHNPYLREGDQVFVPARRDIAIGVTGGVRQSGNFEFVPGDSLSDLILMGFGFRREADSTNGILTRLSPDANTMEKVVVNPAAIVSGREANIALRPGDRLVIKNIPDPRKANIVDIQGEVAQPGQYPLTENSTKLSEVIRAAGGFSPEANIKGATLTRSRISPQSSGEEIAMEQLLSSRSNLGVQDTSYYLTETALRLKGELVSVDFHKLFVLGDSTQDVTLRNYDKIFVPKRTKTVYVFGQVLSPGHAEYIEGKDYRYYIQKAEGYAKDAREGDVKIIKSSTRVWLDPGETEIEDGDYIWVPKERTHPFAYHLNVWAQVAGIVAAAATVALLINNLTK